MTSRAACWNTLLARILQRTDRHNEAREILNTVYQSFTEGFDRPVLRDARALIDELA